MDKLKQKLKKVKSSQTQTDRQSLVLGSIVATFIAATPYLFYTYRSVPSTKIWDTFLFTFESHHYEDANAAVWSFMVKLIPLLLLFIWFFTCRHWWYHALLVPIAMYVWQLIGAFNDETDFIDELGLLYLIPIMGIIIPSIYLIRARMFNKINDADKTLEELEEEFKIKPKSFIDRLGDYF
ncbi:hypothetical protein [Pontimicrobium sp. IMCC45349]|uniref:hypothetical protein n=1 Tax=Pontimicrobium sp. IMCC45349 TaxID=3391574 RepID=UPI00399F4181